MSITPNFFLEKYNYNSHSYQIIEPIISVDFENQTVEYADLWPWNGSHDTFDILTQTNTWPYLSGIHWFGAVPKDCDEKIKQQFLDCSNASSIFDTKYIVYWCTVADIIIYLLKYPTVSNNEKELDTDPDEIQNPIQCFYDRIKIFLELMVPDWENYVSQIRIVYWFT